MINLLKCSIQTELDSFFQLIHQSPTPCRCATKAAFSKARAQFRAHAFAELNDHLVHFFQTHFPVRTWQGMHLLDSSTMVLPKNPDTLDHFDDLPTCSHHQRPLARVSQLFDILNRITLHATIQPCRVEERDLAFSHSSSMRANDLVLLDRGYPATWSFSWLRSESVHSFVRLSSNTWREAKRLVESGQRERIATLTITSASRKKCRELGLATEPIRVRLIRVPLPNGRQYILMTSLLDTDAYPYSSLKDLCHQRWGVEENYKQMKCRLELENFTGKTVHSIEQDFHARIFVMNLTAVLTHPVQDALDRDPQERMHRRQVNFAYALSCMRKTMVHIFYDKKPYQLCRKLMTLFKATVEPVRPGRSFPRKKIRRDHPVYFPCYKPSG